MGALNKAKCAAALWAVCAGGQVSAQTAPAILECKWKSGWSEHIRISPGLWEEWDKVAWVWKVRECEGDTDVKCSVRIEEARYQWHLQGDRFIGTLVRGDPWVKGREVAYLTIDRISGNAKYWFKHTQETWKDPLRTIREKENSGTCQKGTDPALQPKPAPPAPKM
jgi:hypothetical protein